MRRLIKRKPEPEATDSVLQQGEMDLLCLVNKMYEHLISLDKKVDILVDRLSQRPQGSDRFQKPGSSFRRDDRPRERKFTRAVCSQCGKECEIPFKPTGDRPVYCRDCFSGHNSSEPFKEKFGNRPREVNRGEAKASGFNKKRSPFFKRRKSRF